MGDSVSEIPASCSQKSDPMSLDEDDLERMSPVPPRKAPPSVASCQKPPPPIPQFVDKHHRSIQEIPERYRHVFGEYPCFNRVQSMVFDSVFYSAEPLVVTAPTGSGKTVIFELAIIHLLKSFENSSSHNNFKIVYMAPVKALCSEKLHEWARKFSKLKVNCIEVTGDSDVTDLDYLKQHQLILTTPEKWDSLTRRWRDHGSLMKCVRLFLIDEVHILNEEGRGPTLEAVVSRMKMLKQQQNSDNNSLPSLRFIAVSATIPNVEDLAQWLGNHENAAKYFKLEEDMRPVKLHKVVKGFDSSLSSYLFDVHLSYKLKNVITQYSEGKPTLVFCSTRKSVLATAGVLMKMITFSFTEKQKTELVGLCEKIVDNKIREFVKVGIGCHHAGMVMTDRNLLENGFRNELIPVLIATSTLAMGVNLPAHLVVIKSTQFYGNGGYQDYSDSQLLQMIGRAGRPQFDTSATAVIMTRASCEQKYVRLTAGTDPIESSLHRHLVEHLNAEVVLGTVRDLPAAVEWMRSTFLFVRASRQPQHYGLSVPPGPGRAAKISSKLQDMIQVELNGLAKYMLVETNGIDVQDTPAGRLMARYYVAFETMKTFMQVQGEESLSEMLALLAQAAEFQDVQLRNDEKAALNALNSRKDGAQGLRFPIKGRIKNRECKVNCLLQAVLGGLHISEPALLQEANRVVRTAERLSKCLLELTQLSDRYGSLLSAVLLHKCVRCRLWETSALAARQLPRIGPVLAALLTAAGKTSLGAIAQSNPRDLERIVNRLPPFGNELKDAAGAVPRFTMAAELEKGGSAVLLRVDIANLDVVAHDSRHWVAVLVGDSDNCVLVFDRFPCSKLFQGTYSSRIDISNNNADTVKVHLISETWVGIDAEKFIRIKEPQPVLMSAPAKPPKKRLSFMDKMKQLAGRMDDTPSFRLQPNQGLQNGDLTLSQRLEKFKRPEVKRLPSLHLGEDDADDTSAGVQAPWRSASPEKMTADVKEEVVELIDDDMDPWDVQVVPGGDRSPTASRRMEYSALPHQPTITNFFKASKSREEVAAPEQAAPFNLNDTWDMDVLIDDGEDSFVPCTKPSYAAPPTSPGPQDVEKRAGCWDINFDIGIDDLMRQFEEGGEKEAAVKDETEMSFDKWCDEEDRATLGRSAAASSSSPMKTVVCGGAAQATELDFDKWCDEEDRATLGRSAAASSSSPMKTVVCGGLAQATELDLDKWCDEEDRMGRTRSPVVVDNCRESDVFPTPSASFDGFGGSGEWPGDEELRRLDLPDDLKQEASCVAPSVVTEPSRGLDDPAADRAVGNSAPLEGEGKGVSFDEPLSPDLFENLGDTTSSRGAEPDAKEPPQNTVIGGIEDHRAAVDSEPEPIQSENCVNQEVPAEAPNLENIEPIAERTEVMKHSEEGSPERITETRPRPVADDCGTSAPQKCPAMTMQRVDKVRNENTSQAPINVSPHATPSWVMPSSHQPGHVPEEPEIVAPTKWPRAAETAAPTKAQLADPPFVVAAEAEASGRPSSPTPASRGRDAEVKTAGKQPQAPANPSSTRSIATLSRTFQSVIVASKPTADAGAPSNSLHRFRPHAQPQAPADDALARLISKLADDEAAPGPSAAGRPAPRVLDTQESALLYNRSGVLASGPARRASGTAAAAVPSATPADKKLDFVERILQEGVPRRLLSARTVNINTERLAAARATRGSGLGTGINTVFATRLSKGLAAAGATGRVTLSTPGAPKSPPVTSSGLCNGSTGGEDKGTGHAVSGRGSPGRPVPAAVPATPSSPPPDAKARAKDVDVVTTQAARTPDSAYGTGTIQTPMASSVSSVLCATKVFARSVPMPPLSRTPQEPSVKLDWFERLISEPVGGRVRRLSHPRPQTSKRKAEDEPSPVEFKRSPSLRRLPGLPLPVLPPVQRERAYMKQPSSCSLSTRWGALGALSVTATRTPTIPAAAASPAPTPASGDWRRPYRSGLERPGSPVFQDDEDMPGPSHGRRVKRPAADLSRAVVRDTGFDEDDDLDASFSEGCSQHWDDGRGDFNVDPSSPCRIRRRGDFDWPPESERPWDEDDAWRENTSPSISGFQDPHGELFVRQRYTEETSPTASWSGRGVGSSPSYSPAPLRQSSFKWQPSLPSRSSSEDGTYLGMGSGGSGRGEDPYDDPFEYVPQATRPRPLALPTPESYPYSPRPAVVASSPAHSVYSAASAASTPPRAAAAPPVPPTPAAGGRLVISLSPPPRRTPVVSFSKWNNFLD